MKDLLYKEFRLAIHPSVYFFLACGALLLIPDWPFFVAFLYILIGFMNTFVNGKADQDVFFTACLPVRKSDAVLARVLSTAALEVIMIAAAVPFAYLNTFINPTGNTAGMNPNFAFFGFVLMMYALFNAILFPAFYRTAYKIGAPLFWGSLAFMLFGGAVETVVHVFPVLNETVNAFGAGHLPVQLAVLLAGIAVFLLLTWLSFIRAAKNFDKVDI